MSQPTLLASALAWLDARLDDAAEAFAAVAERLRPRRRVVFVEQGDGSWLGPNASCRIEGGQLAFAGVATAFRGAEIEFRVLASRCVFRELELPARAGEFLQGVVRAQIDRLTPWRADAAAFGWGAPQPRDGERIAVNIAATKRAPIAPLLDVAADVVAVTTTRAGDAAPIVLLSRCSGAGSRRRFWRFAVLAALAVSLAAGLGAAVLQATLVAGLQERTDQLIASLQQRRAAILRREHANDDPAARTLDARKRASPAAVIVLEALTRAIPDDAYLLQMRLKGDKIEIAGLAADSAALVKHIEQSPHFAHATFTAPTTRGAENRETFRIEAQVTPLQRVSP